MFGISFGEIFVFSVIALIILGPEKFPQTLRTVLQKYQHLKKILSKVQQDLEHELELIELKQFMQEELERIKQNELQLQARLLEMQSKIENVDTKSKPTITKIDPIFLYTKQSNFNQVPYIQSHLNCIEVNKVA